MITVLEISANAVITGSILLAGRNSIHTWWTGIVGCLLFTIIFYQAKLYADVVLQLFFITTSILGWIKWTHGKSGCQLEVSRTAWRTLAGFVIIGLVVTSIYGVLLHNYTDAYAPFIDSAVLVFSVIAQLLLMKRRIESWVFWLIVNTIAVPLFASRELYLTSVLYSAYWINAVVAWFWWRRQMPQLAIQKAA